MALEKFNKVGMRDKETKKVVVFPKFSSIGEFYNGFAITKVITYRNGIQKTKYGYLSEYGVEIPAIYNQASNFYEEGFASIERDGVIGILLKDGTEHLFKGATTIWPCSGVEGIYKMLTWEGWGYIKIRNGEYTKLTEAKYSVADDFIFNMAHVAQGVYSGIIDENGKEVLPLKYGSAEQLSENLFHVTFDGKSVIIDRNEDVLLEEVEYVEIRKYTTTTFSNIGRVGIIGEYQKYIDKFLMLIAPESVEKIKCSACSFENNLVFSFTSSLESTEVEEEFCMKLREEGIEINVEGNGVHDFISEN